MQTRPALGLHRPADHFHQHGFAAAVSSNDPGDLLFYECGVDVFKYRLLSKALCQIFELQAVNHRHLFFLSVRQDIQLMDAVVISVF